MSSDVARCTDEAVAVASATLQSHELLSSEQDGNAKRAGFGSTNDARKFLATITASCPDDQWGYVWTLDGQKRKRTHWFQFQDGIEPVLELAASQRDKADVYFGVATAAAPRGENQRVLSSETSGIYGLWADIDWDHSTTHKKLNLPPTREAALEILTMVGVPPTIVVDSGHGLHAWWVFGDFWRFESDADRDAAQSLEQRWQDTIGVRAAQRGWVIDRTFDLARVLRLPGTLNHKDPSNLKDVTIVSMGSTVSPSDFEDFLVAPEEISKLGLSAARSYVVGEFKLSPDAEPPRGKMEALRANHDTFGITVDRKRPEFADQSPSSYDLALATIAASAGWSDQEIVDLLISVRRAHGDDLKLRQDYYSRTIRKARDTVGPDGPVDLPVIVTTTRNHHELISESHGALVKANDPPELFERSGRMVRVRREGARPVIERLTPVSVAVHLSKAANYVSRNQSGALRPTAPPELVRKGVLEQSDMAGIPPLVGVSHVPIVRADGTVRVEPGYDAATSYLYLPPAGLNVQAAPAKPSASEVAEAVQAFRDIFEDFPFTSPAGFANVMAAMLTPLVAVAVDGHRPLCLINARAPGTGKTLIAKIISQVATGRSLSAGTAPGNEAEFRKRISAQLDHGDPLIVYDNLNAALESESLSSVLTTDNWEDRQLGLTKLLCVPNRSTFVVTGNNIALAGDLGRRSYPIDLDAQMERPFERTGFRHRDLERHVRTHRGALITALLTLVQHWYAEGQPECTTPVLGSFEEWTRVIGGILGAAQIEGFLADQGRVYDRLDRGEDEWAGFATWWKVTYGKAVVTSAEAAKRIRADDDGSIPLPTQIARALEKATFPNILGHALSGRVGVRHPGGLYFERAGKSRDGVAQWMLQFPPE